MEEGSSRNLVAPMTPAASPGLAAGVSIAGSLGGAGLTGSSLGKGYTESSAVETSERGCREGDRRGHSGEEARWNCLFLTSTHHLMW